MPARGAAPFLGDASFILFLFCCPFLCLLLAQRLERKLSADFELGVALKAEKASQHAREVAAAEAARKTTLLGSPRQSPSPRQRPEWQVAPRRPLSRGNDRSVDQSAQAAQRREGSSPVSASLSAFREETAKKLPAVEKATAASVVRGALPWAPAPLRRASRPTLGSDHE